MMSRVRRQGRACIAAALLLSVAFSAGTPAQARPPEHHPAAAAATSSSNSAATAATWTAIEQSATAGQGRGGGFWAPVYAFVVAWKSAIRTLVFHVRKGGNNGSEVCS
jgi:hypothetical protein